jgi:Tannase and feruloyl esterase
MRIGGLLIAKIISLSIVLGPHGSWATEVNLNTTVPQCTVLGTADFASIQDAPTQVTSARFVEASSGVPAYCQVRGYVSPQVGIDLRLPISNWNGRFVEVGCGGFCGVMDMRSCDDPLQRGYACIGSDMGHSSTALDGKWSYNNLQAQVDYGFRSTHVAAVAGKAIVEYFYKKQPEKSYYLGCSCGGRQGLVEAQQFPWDFDGIVVGSPALNFSGVFMDLLWKTRAVFDNSGNPLFNDDDIRLVHNAAIAKCDNDDGVKDGLIGDPRKCNFDPKELACKSAERNGCLSVEQVEAIKRLYSGPLTSKGESIVPGGSLPGSETSFLGIKGYETVFATFAREFFQYMGFVPAAGPVWKSTDFDFDRDYKRLGMLESLYASTNPDLRRFKTAGGKLIMYHGWADGGISPLNTIDYYEAVGRAMGGPKATRDFLRLFMVPGMDHCSGGEGASTIDFLGYMEAWVEHGHAPDVMISAHLKSDTDTRSTGLPLDPHQIAFTRPLYPYPAQARYKGVGDINQAENYGPVWPK